jgi:Xaa-Pro dipeptidase
MRETMHKRRDFLKLSATAAAGAAFMAAGNNVAAQSMPDPIKQLKPMLDGVVPVNDGERWDRIDKAQRLMTENGIGANFIESGTSSF